MNAFDSLHPALQHHIVNSLGWRSLRPLQEQSIDAVMANRHVIMLAPTAGGKTEACIFPLFSRMLFENWSRLSILYICPLKALLNNLNVRLQGYSALIGRRSDVWHGDTPQTDRKKLLYDPPDCLLTTPESLEAMLISSRTDHLSFLSDIKAVVIDEIHALAGDDRGWHLLSILERLTSITGREIQRIGLSATVGNPDELLNWLSGHCKGKRTILLPPPVARASDIDITIDYVGSLDNAAVVLSRLYRGEKRLVFCDSRSRVEQLATELKRQGVRTYVSHSSLSAEERRCSEHAFNYEKDCIIVSTSALELGIDIGDLDRVIQIDAPATVSSFLQRLGRTGRRVESKKNCLFLATSDYSLLQAAGLINLWQAGYVEPVTPPPSPYHVFVQQYLGLILQEKGLGAITWRDWIGRLPIFETISDDSFNLILLHMLKKKILSHDQGIVWLGPKGESLYGFKNFMEICSTFVSPKLFEVRFGNHVIGYVDEITFAAHSDEQIVLLAGKEWKVKHANFNKKIAQVEPTTLAGRSTWIGAGPFLGKKLCLEIKQILLSGGSPGTWSKRAINKIDDIRKEFDWIEADSTVMDQRTEKPIWWTFGGKLTNINIAAIINHKFGVKAHADNLSIHLGEKLNIQSIENLRTIDIHSFFRYEVESFVADHKTPHKFHECLPDSILIKMITDRFICGKIYETLNPKIKIVSR